MKEVDVRIVVYLPDEQRQESEGRVGLRSTAADTLRDLVERFLGKTAASASWEAFFYDVENDGLLLAYLSDSNEHEVFHDASVLKFH